MSTVDEGQIRIVLNRALRLLYSLVADAPRTRDDNAPNAGTAVADARLTASGAIGGERDLELATQRGAKNVWAYRQPPPVNTPIRSHCLERHQHVQRYWQMPTA